MKIREKLRRYCSQKPQNRFSFFGSTKQKITFDEVTSIKLQEPA